MNLFLCQVPVQQLSDLCTERNTLNYSTRFDGCLAERGFPHLKADRVATLITAGRGKTAVAGQRTLISAIAVEPFCS